jgi:carbonic anhydrase/acetyltransferase-like protein (isoleucine patch superfamily)
MPSSPFVTAFGDHRPIIATQVFVDRSARLIGQVELAPGSSVWPGAVLRADDARIRVGEGSAVLDMALLEAPQGCPVLIAPEALVSHKACLHGARVERGALVGIGAIVLDGAVVGAGALVGAGAVVPPGMAIPPATLVLGQPAKVIRELRDEERQRTRAQLAEVAAKAAQYLAAEQAAR